MPQKAMRYLQVLRRLLEHDTMINGEITADRLQDKLFQRQIMQEVLIASMGYGSLNDDAVVKRAQVAGSRISPPDCWLS